MKFLFVGLFFLCIQLITIITVSHLKFHKTHVNLKQSFNKNKILLEERHYSSSILKIFEKSSKKQSFFQEKC